MERCGNSHRDRSRNGGSTRRDAGRYMELLSRRCSQQEKRWPEPGEGGQAPGTAQQPRVHGIALPGLGRAKGWSFDGKREVRGAQGGKLGVLQVPAYPLPSPWA